MLGSVGLAICSRSFLNVVNPGKKNGAALIGAVLNLGGTSTKAVAFFQNKARIPSVHVNCLPRCGGVSRGFPVSMCRIVLSNLEGDV